MNPQKVALCPEEYTCANCHKTNHKGWTDKEANAESESIFGVKNPKDDPRFVVVCDDCYQLMNPKNFPELVEKAKEELRTNKK